MTVVGLLLAAGAGRRMGAPKALVADEHGLPWVVGGARTLAAGGCAPVVVVVGAAAPSVRAALAGEPVVIVEAADWASGMGASLRAGLQAIASSDAGADADAGARAGARADTSADAALVHLVDLPDVGPDVIRRVRAYAGRGILARASYGPAAPVGHPVLIGRDHWAGVIAAAHGDAGARGYLAAHRVTVVDCADLALGIDVDRPEGLLTGRTPLAPGRTPLAPGRTAPRHTAPSAVRR